MAKKLVMASTPGCHHCVQARILLNKLGLKYKEKKIIKNADWDWLEGKVGIDDVGVPQFFINGKHIGGLDRLTLYAKKRALNPKTRLAAKKRKPMKDDGLLTWNKTKGNAILIAPRQLINDLLKARMISRIIRGDEQWKDYLVWKQDDGRKFFYRIKVPVREWHLSAWKIRCLKASCKFNSKGYDLPKSASIVIYG